MKGQEMIISLLNEISKSNGPVNISTLQNKLGVDRSTLEGMLKYLIQNRYLVNDQNQTSDDECNPNNCGVRSIKDCPFASTDQSPIYKRKYKLELNRQ